MDAVPLQVPDRVAVEKPGFFENIGGHGKISVETRFLAFSRSGGDRVPVEKPGFFSDLGGHGKISAETRFLAFSRSGANPMGIEKSADGRSGV